MTLQRYRSFSEVGFAEDNIDESWGTAGGRLLRSLKHIHNQFRIIQFFSGATETLGNPVVIAVPKYDSHIIL